jgi:hypothetical protein
MTPDLPGPDSPLSADGVSTGVTPHPDAGDDGGDAPAPRAGAEAPLSVAQTGVVPGWLTDALARIRYTVRIHGPQVTVSRYDGEPDSAPKWRRHSRSSSRAR